MYGREKEIRGNFDNTVMNGMKLVAAEVVETKKTPGSFYISAKFKKELPNGGVFSKQGIIMIPGPKSQEFAKAPKEISKFLDYLGLLNDAIGDGEAFTTREDYMNDSLENMKPLAEKFCARMNCFPDVEYTLFGHYKHVSINDDDKVVFDPADAYAVYNGKPSVQFSGQWWQPGSCKKRPWMSDDKLKVIAMVIEGNFIVDGQTDDSDSEQEASDDIPF
jgi:hypothetical protein